MKNKYLLFFLSISLLLFSCAKEKNSPYITFMNKQGDIILSDVLNVDLNSETTLYVECGFFSDGFIFYERQIDSNNTYDITSETPSDIQIQSITSTQTQDRDEKVPSAFVVEKATIKTSFNDSIVSSGSKIVIIVRDGERLAKRLTYQLK